MRNIFLVFCIFFQTIVFASRGGRTLLPEDNYYDFVSIKFFTTNPLNPPELYRSICLGEFINDHTIITAAHCLWDEYIVNPDGTKGKMVPNRNIFIYYSLIPLYEDPFNDPIIGFPKTDPSITIKGKPIVSPLYIQYTMQSNPSIAESVANDVALIFVGKAVNYLSNNFQRLHLNNSLNAYETISNLKNNNLAVFSSTQESGNSGPIGQIYFGYNPIYTYLSNDNPAISCNEIFSQEIQDFENVLKNPPIPLDEEQKKWILRDIGYGKEIESYLENNHESFFCTAHKNTELPNVTNIFLGGGDSGGALMLPDYSFVGVLGFGFDLKSLELPTNIATYQNIMLYNSYTDYKSWLLKQVRIHAGILPITIMYL